MHPFYNSMHPFYNIHYTILQTLDISRSPIWHDNTQRTTVTMIQIRPEFAFTNKKILLRTTPHISPSQASYGVPVAKSSKNLTAIYRERTLCKNATSILHGYLLVSAGNTWRANTTLFIAPKTNLQINQTMSWNPQHTEDVWCVHLIKEPVRPLVITTVYDRYIRFVCSYR